MKLPLEMILPLLLQASILRIVTGTGCSSVLGMVSGGIRDSQLTASTSYSSYWGPNKARLNNAQAWYPSSYSRSEWLQIDMLERTSITGIQTQGHYHWLWRTSYYAISFKLRYSDDGMDWITYQYTGFDKVFNGNYNSYGVTTNNIDPPIVAQFIRIMAESWPSSSGFAFRLELLGCLQLTTTQTTTALSTTNVATTSAITTFMTTMKQTTRTTLMNTYPRSSIKSTTIPTEGITSAVPHRSASPASSGPGTPSPPSNNTSGNSDGLADNQAGTPSVAIIGGAVAAGVVVLIIAIIVSIFFIRRRRSKPADEKESSPQADDTGTVDNIYYGGVTFAANGNASTNGNVSIGQSDRMVDNHLYAYAGTTNGYASTTDQSEGMVDNHLYAGTTNGNVPIDQSEGTVDNHLYAGTGDACLETRHHVGDEGAQENVYYNVAHMSDEGFVENHIY